MFRDTSDNKTLLFPGEAVRMPDGEFFRERALWMQKKGIVQKLGKRFFLAMKLLDFVQK